MTKTRERTGRTAALMAELAKLPHADAARVEALYLLDRVETKFLLTEPGLPSLVRALSAYHGLPPANGNLLAGYKNLYFETPQQTFYLQHHRGLRPRYKVRIRHYLDRSVSVLDLKCKTNHDVTHKTQLEHAFQDSELNDEDRLFVQDHVPITASDLEPQAWVSFRRITLLGLEFPERVTIDLDLSFEGHGRSHRLPGLAIVEVKQARFSPRSPAMLVLRDRGVRPTRVSKYCTAQIHLDPTIRHNRFRDLKRAIRRLTHA